MICGSVRGSQVILARGWFLAGGTAAGCQELRGSNLWQSLASWTVVVRLAWELRFLFDKAVKANKLPFKKCPGKTLLTVPDQMGPSNYVP